MRGEGVCARARVLVRPASGLGGATGCLARNKTDPRAAVCVYFVTARESVNVILPLLNYPSPPPPLRLWGVGGDGRGVGGRGVGGVGETCRRWNRRSDENYPTVSIPINILQRQKIHALQQQIKIQIVYSGTET